MDWRYRQYNSTKPIITVVIVFIWGMKIFIPQLIREWGNLINLYIYLYLVLRIILLTTKIMAVEKGVYYIFYTNVRAGRLG